MAWNIELDPGRAESPGKQTTKIRNLDVNKSARFQNSVNFPEKTIRIPDMFQNMPHPDTVERPRGEPMAVKIAEMHIKTLAFHMVVIEGIVFNADGFYPLRAEEPEKCTPAIADLEHRVSPFQKPEGLPFDRFFERAKMQKCSRYSTSEAVAAVRFCAADERMCEMEDRRVQSIFDSGLRLGMRIVLGRIVLRKRRF